MHAIWTLPPDDTDYTGRWKAIKIAFAKTLPKTERLSRVRAAKGERGIWQRRYWEHGIRDEQDYGVHLDYVHINPLKHGLVACVWDWLYSSFHRYVAQGAYSPDWAGQGLENLAAGEREGLTRCSHTYGGRRCAFPPYACYVGSPAIACIMTLGKCRPSPGFGDRRPLKMQAESNV